jgi:lysophospholipase L1-like esterase
MCVYHGNGYVYVHFERSYGTYPIIYGESGIAVAIGDNISKGILTPVSNFKPSAIIHQSRSKDLLVPITTPSFYGYNIYRFMDFPSQLEYESSTRTYRVLGIVDTLKQKDGSIIGTYGYGVSPNGRWLILFDSDRLVRYDLETNTSVVLAHKDFTVGHTDPSPNMHGFISNDGYTMGAVGRTEAVWVLEANAGCVAAAEDYNFSENSPGIMVTPCPYRDLRDYVYGFSEPASPQSGGIRIYDHPLLSQDKAALIYYDNHVWHQIFYQPQPVLQYLALGDSFSSGEGDLNDGNYIEGTNIFGDYSANIPRENCHISKNSYPMLLSAGMSFVYTQDSQSVACSGAVIRDVWSEDPSNDVLPEYMGQSTNAAAWSLKPKPRLEGIANATQLQASAYSTYTPGRIQQINFVHSVKPAVLTVSIGGNDAGFAPALTTCILESIQLSAVTATADCHLATVEGKAATAKDISNLYPRLKAMYRQLQTASPSTKIYAIGYPTFIDDQADSCGSELIVGSMTRDDRVAINQFVMYLNAVIKSAAHDANITYIDVSNAIGASRLCGDGTAVNGVNAIIIKGIMTEYMKDKVHADENIKKYGEILGTLHNTADFSFLSKYESERMGQQLAPFFVSPTTALTNRLQEILHPNAKGHQLMYDQMVAGLGSDLLYSSSCNTIVICPGGPDMGVPRAGDYITGVADLPDVVYGRIGQGLGVTHVAASGQTVNDSLQQDQPGSIVLSAETYNELVPDSVSAPVVSIHSLPYELGRMTKQPNGDYRLEIDHLSPSLAAGWHTIHLNGMLTSGRVYNLYHEVFVEGPEGDYDDDGILDAQDTCAFATPSGRDVNRNSIDDSCDLSVFATLPRNDEPSNNVVPMKQYHGTEWAIESDQDSSTTASGVISRNLPISHVAGVRDGGDSRIGITPDSTSREGIWRLLILLFGLSVLVYVGKRLSATDK